MLTQGCASRAQGGAWWGPRAPMVRLWDTQAVSSKGGSRGSVVCSGPWSGVQEGFLLEVPRVGSEGGLGRGTAWTDGVPRGSAALRWPELASAWRGGRPCGPQCRACTISLSQRTPWLAVGLCCPESQARGGARSQERQPACYPVPWFPGAALSHALPAFVCRDGEQMVGAVTL